MGINHITPHSLVGLCGSSFKGKVSGVAQVNVLVKLFQLWERVFTLFNSLGFTPQLGFRGQPSHDYWVMGQPHNSYEINPIISYSLDGVNPITPALAS